MADQRTEELMRIAREADKQDRERIELFEVMVKTPAWRAFVEILDKRLQGESDLLMEPARGLDGCFNSEYVKGTMKGLILARDIPAAMIAAKPQLRPVTETVETDDDDAA